MRRAGCERNLHPSPCQLFPHPLFVNLTLSLPPLSASCPPGAASHGAPSTLKWHLCLHPPKSLAEQSTCPSPPSSTLPISFSPHPSLLDSHCPNLSHKTQSPESFRLQSASCRHCNRPRLDSGDSTPISSSPSLNNPSLTGPESLC
jgi:hypothetical protein